MSVALQARYCDGETARSHAVELHAGDDGLLRLAGEGVARIIPARSVTVSPLLGRVPRFLRLRDGGVIEVPAEAEFDRVLAAVRPPGRLECGIHWLESRAVVAAASTIILAAAVAGTVWLGLPRLARRAAYAVPEAIEVQAGKTGYAVFAQAFAASDLGYADQRRVQRQLTRLEAARALHVKPTLAFMRMNAPNAFALPGGIIVVTDELVRLAKNDDELAAVLAHELAHVERRHGLQSVLRSSSALIVVATITGDLSTLTSFSGTLPFILLQHGYAREFEREADADAVVLLRAAHIDPVNLATILQRLENERPTKGGDFSYLSSHPATEERVKFVQSFKLSPAIKPPAPAAAHPPQPRADPKPAKVSYFANGAVLQLIHQELPVYPTALREAGITGDAVVELIVDTEGNVMSAFALTSTRQEFEAPALAAVRQWKFRPSVKNGRTVNARLMYTIRFTLDDDAPARPE